MLTTLHLTVIVIVIVGRFDRFENGVCCCAGTAAVNVGGMTLHSFTGIRERTKPKVKLAEGLWKWAKFRESWRKIDALLLDEVSMVDCELLEKVSGYCPTLCDRADSCINRQSALTCKVGYTCTA
jgi:hypothetical protein